MTIELYDYQQRDVDRIRLAYKDTNRVLFRAPTGYGKTIVFCYIAKSALQKNRTTLILVHREQLIRQIVFALKQFGVEAGVICSGYPEHSWRHVQVASVQTLVRRLDKYQKPGMIVVDECFPAGTLIDDRPIKEIQAGDMVLSFNHRTSTIEKKPVTHVFKSTPKSLVTITLKSGKSITCTANHPFFTPGGYKPAISLTQSDYCYAKNRNLHLCDMRVELSGYCVPQEPAKKSMLARLQERAIFEDDGEHKSALCVCENDQQQPHEQPRNTPESAENLARYWAQTESSRGQRARHDETTGDALECTGREVDGRKNCQDGAQELLSKPLQARHSTRGKANSNRSGRLQPLRTIEASTRQEEGGFSCWDRVESVQVHEQTDNGEFGGLCAGGFVYNLEIEGNHNYFANGVLVHNCHHAVSNTYLTIIEHFKDVPLLGVTATPWRMNGQGLGDVFGKMVQGPTESELIAMGRLKTPKYFMPPTSFDRVGLRKTGGDFNRGQTEKRTDKPTITGDAVKHWRKYADGLKTITFCTTISHAEHVAAQFTSAGIPTASIDGTMSYDQRGKIIDDLQTGRLLNMTSVDLVGEGFDLPALECAILLRPTASLVVHKQQVGRALRPVKNVLYGIIIDCVGNCAANGFVEDEIEWSLEGVKKQDADKKPLEPRRCENCFALYPRYIHLCPECGTPAPVQEREIINVAGDLQEVTAEDRERMARERRKEVGRARNLEALTKLGASRGYKKPEFWAQKILESRQSRASQQRQYYE